MLIRRPNGVAVPNWRRKKRSPAMLNGDASNLSQAKAPRKRPPSRPLLEMWLPADPQAVPPARHKACEVCRQAGVSEEDCFTLDLALGEALANAVVHGAPVIGDEPAPDHVCLSVWNFHDRLIVEVHDRGPGFDPPLPPYDMPRAEAEETHGRGLPLMQLLTDALIVCRGDAQEGGASIYLIKKITN